MTTLPRGTATKRPRALWLDALTLVLWALATLWVGWSGLVVFLVGLIVGGAGTVYNGVTRGGWSAR